MTGSEKSADAYRTISEVADGLKLPQHVLRFWETRFPQIKPMKRGGGRRFYSPDDVDLLRAIQKLLYGEGYTIKGVQRILKEQGPRAVAALAAGHASGRAGEAALAGRRPTAPPAGRAAAFEDGAADVAGCEVATSRPDPGLVSGIPDTGRHSSTASMPSLESSRGIEILVDRLQEVLLDLAECGRLLAGARN